MKNLLNIGRSLSTIELKEVMAGHHVLTQACQAYGNNCGAEMSCNVYGQCTPNGGGGICPENVGMQC